MNISKIYFLPIFIVILSCSVKKEITYIAPESDLKEELLDTLVISDVANALDSLPKEYHGTATMRYDILHTKLDLNFDWQHQYVIGKAYLTLKPYYRDIDSLSLDAVGFEVKNIQLLPSGKMLKYQNDGRQLHIILDRKYTRTEKFEIFIEYVAKPNENLDRGGTAITSEKGLFFIDPLGIDPDLPTQIWSQGETEFNSAWFPTFDKPNERFSQEIILTIDNKYQTLSNGKKISSTMNADGTRTDHWKQDIPHAPYLAMIAVGEFDEVSDTWNKVPLQYMVDKGYGRYAKDIFHYTPEMLTFFSEKLAYPYPWDKYAQIIVKEYVSGAMENTGAVIFSDEIQKTDKELIDSDNDQIVAHEMMHHWFGDLVTCEDWSNLTLNEGFANYAEYLWYEHKYGKDRAEFHRLNEMNGYFSQVYGSGGHPLINYYYTEKDQMFDAHSYNKGGLVLHMLRSYLGDDVFFAGLNKYLKDNALSAVEVDELRMAFEDISGEDLHWFFDQWYMGIGHPHINVNYTYHSENKALLIETDMSSTPDGFTKNFKLPVDVALYYADGSVTYHPAIIDENKDRILIENIKADPVTYVLDGKNILLALINENKTTEQYKAQFKYSNNFLDKIIAYSSTNDGNQDLIVQALNDKFYLFRTMGIHSISDSLAGQYFEKINDMVLTDPHSDVRGSALVKLLSVEDFDPKSICKIILNSEKAYPVIQLALEVMGQIEPENINFYIEKFKNEDSDILAPTLAALMTDASDSNLQYLEKKAATIKVSQVVDFYTSYSKFLMGKDLKVLERATNALLKVTDNKNINIYRKFMIINALDSIQSDIQQRFNTVTNGEANVLLEKLNSSIVALSDDDRMHELQMKMGH